MLPSRALLLFAAFAASGCARPLNMARAYQPDRPALTIAYTAVGEATRLHADYSHVGASILASPGKKEK